MYYLSRIDILKLALVFTQSSLGDNTRLAILDYWPVINMGSHQSINSCFLFLFWHQHCYNFQIAEKRHTVGILYLLWTQGHHSWANFRVNLTVLGANNYDNNSKFSFLICFQNFQLCSCFYQQIIEPWKLCHKPRVTVVGPLNKRHFIAVKYFV